MFSTNAVFFCFLVIIGTSWFTGGDISGLAFALAMPGYSNKQNYELVSPCYQPNGQSGPCPQQFSGNGGAHFQQNSRLENPGQQYSYQYPEYNFNQQLNDPNYFTPQQKLEWINAIQQYYNHHLTQQPTVVFVPQPSYPQSTEKNPYEGRPILSILDWIHKTKMGILQKIFGKKSE